MIPSPTRRRFLASLAVLPLTPLAAADARLFTPSQMEGPFYPVDLPLDDDNDLTRVTGQARRAQGIITDLAGRVLDLNGQPIRQARVEIWQCDARGFYHHPRDRGGQADPGFQGFGQTTTDAQGQYRFRTLRPVSYPGRTPHIHARVLIPGEAAFTTQIYIAGEPGNARDFLFRQVPVAKRPLLLAQFEPASQGRQSARFDFVMASRDGTPRV